jgi:hypothetical protein
VLRPVSPTPDPVHHHDVPADDALVIEVDDERHVIEMGGDNLVIRAASAVDLDRTRTLVDAVNAASAAGVTVVIDPHTERCDDVLAAFGERVLVPCRDHNACTPAPVEVASSGCVRLLGDDTVWTIDLEGGRLCRTDDAIDLRFVPASAWIDVVAVHVGPRRLRASTNDGRVFSTARRHDDHDRRPHEPVCA